MQVGDVERDRGELRRKCPGIGSVRSTAEWPPEEVREKAQRHTAGRLLGVRLRALHLAQKVSGASVERREDTRQRHAVVQIALDEMARLANVLVTLLIWRAAIPRQAITNRAHGGGRVTLGLFLFDRRDSSPSG